MPACLNVSFTSLVVLLQLSSPWFVVLRSYFLCTGFFAINHPSYRSFSEDASLRNGNGEESTEKIAISQPDSCLKFPSEFHDQTVEQPSSMVYVQASELFPKKTHSSGLCQDLPLCQYNKYCQVTTF